MDKIFKNTIYRERQFFLSKIKSNPLFLLQHIRSLSSMLGYRYWTKYLIKCRSPHFGNKTRPKWLQHIKKLDQSTYVSLSTLCSRIPERKIPPYLSSKLSATNSSHSIPLRRDSMCCHGVKLNNRNLSSDVKSQDLEDYLVHHRFSILVNNVLSAGCNTPLPTSIKNWLTHPPKKQDPAWEPYSVCERVANLLTWISFIPLQHREKVLPPSIFSFLEESMHWIFSHLEFYGKKTGNHILNNARALIMAGVILENKSAIETGMIILHHMLPILIQPNGSLRERSSHYHLIVLTWLLDVYIFMQTFYLDLSAIEFIKKTILQMKEVANIFCNDKGELQACIGDISPDAAPIISAQRLIICYPTYWPHLTTHHTKMSYDDWWTLSLYNNKIILNCPKGHYPRQFPSHAHNDISSFVWLHQGEPVLIDSGRSRYMKDDISIMQKGASGHTIPLVNGFAPLCESLVIHGNWWPIPYASANIQVHSHHANSITLSHDGFRRATPVREHKRNITLFEHQVHICDSFKGAGHVNITLIWQLSPSFTLFERESLTLSNGKKTIEIVLDETEPDFILEYHLDSTANWYSHEYGSARPSPVLSIKYKVNLPFESNIIFRVKTCVA